MAGLITVLTGMLLYSASIIPNIYVLGMWSVVPFGMMIYGCVEYKDSQYNQ
jgi:hypothetical protein